MPILIGVGLIWYSLSSMSEDSRQTLWQNIKNANPYWVALSLSLAVLSHFSRAYRWKFLLEPLGYKPKLMNRFLAVMVAYIANLGIPRSGEVLRGATLSTYEGVPFQKAFGTIISERVADLVMLMIIIGMAFFSQSGNMLNYFEEYNINPFLPIAILVTLIILFVVFLKLIKYAKNSFLIKVKDFAQGVLEGIKSILYMKKKKEFLFHTFLIWGLYLLMFWVIKFAVPNMEDTSWGIILVAFVAGSFSMSTTNGGLGLFPYPIVVGAIFVFSGIAKEDGEAFGWVIWGAQTILNIILGGISLIILPIYNRKSNKTTPF